MPSDEILFAKYIIYLLTAIFVALVINIFAGGFGHGE